MPLQGLLGKNVALAICDRSGELIGYGEIIGIAHGLIPMMQDSFTPTTIGVKICAAHTGCACGPSSGRRRHGWMGCLGIHD
jgi:hypothetical protein